MALDSLHAIKAITPDRRRRQRRAEPEDALEASARMLGLTLIGAVLSLIWFAVGFGLRGVCCGS